MNPNKICAAQNGNKGVDILLPAGYAHIPPVSILSGFFLEPLRYA
jgi:hypothetical protein